MVLEDEFDAFNFKVKLSAKVPCESQYLVHHFFGVHVVFAGTEQLKVTCKYLCYPFGNLVLSIWKPSETDSGAEDMSLFVTLLLSAMDRS